MCWILSCVKIADVTVCVPRMNFKLMTEYVYSVGYHVFNKMSLWFAFLIAAVFLPIKYQILNDVIQNANRLMKLIIYF